MPEASHNERVVKVADIDPRHRHTIILRLFEHLAPDDSLQIVVDHDPKPLHLQLDARHGALQLVIPRERARHLARSLAPGDSQGRR